MLPENIEDFCFVNKDIINQTKIYSELHPLINYIIRKLKKCQCVRMLKLINLLND